jgi:predicted transposase YdaD
MRESVIFQDILEEGKQVGRQEEAISLIMRLLTRRCGTMDAQLQQRIRDLSLVRQEDLAEALLDFSEISDLVAWLEENQEI